MSDGVARNRPERKRVSFTAEEWRQIERRMKLSGARSFDAFARDVLLSSRVKVVKIPFDPAPLRADLARIGNNINQIARQVNIEEVTTASEMMQTRKLLREVQQLIESATRRGR